MNYSKKRKGGGLYLDKFFRNIGLYLLILLVSISAINYFSLLQESKVKEIKYSEFVSSIEKNQVQEVTIVGENVISGTLKGGATFKTYAPNDPDLVKKLLARNITVDSQPPPEPPWWSPLLSSILPTLILIGIMIFIMQQMQGGGSRVMSFGKSRAKLHTEEKTKVTFDDVAGVEEAKQELAEVVDFLKQPKKFLELGARIPKGVLLFGPPGTGKTLLARAVAGEAGVPFFSISGSDFVEMFVGVGASRVRDLFDQAKKTSPCIIFIDEIDAVGRQRGAGLGGGHDEREQTLNQLLVEMDGFGANEGIVVLAGTNRPDVLDPALLRPGRFDRQIVVDKPDLAGRKAILNVHMKGKPTDETVNIDILARKTPGFTGADLSNLVNEAALLTARRAKKKIGMSEFDDATERVIAGPERKSRLISEKEKRIVAHHEGGHALVAKMLNNTDPVHKISIIPRGGALGYVLQLPEEDRYLMTKSELLDKVTVMLGGRVAEQIIFQEISTGAQNDLDRATDLVRKIICEYGMSEKLGPITFGKGQGEVFLGRDFSRARNYSEEIAYDIDKELKQIIEDCYRKAETILTEGRSKLEKIADILLTQETIEADELEEILKNIS